MAASSFGSVGLPDSTPWAKRNEMMVVDARLRAGGGKASLGPPPPWDLHHPDFLLFGVSLSFFLFLLPFRHLR